MTPMMPRAPMSTLSAMAPLVLMVALGPLGCGAPEVTEPLAPASESEPARDGDVTPPRVQLMPMAPWSSGTDAPLRFVLEITDNASVDVSSIGLGDVSLARPDDAMALVPDAAAVDTPVNGTPRRVFYDLEPPSGTWGVGDNGLYTVMLAEGEVLDVFGNAAEPGPLGTIEVAVPEQVEGGVLEVAVLEGGALDGTTIASSSMVLENVGEAQITEVVIDLGTAALPDLVFDPSGGAVHAEGKALTADAGASAAGFEGPGEGSEPFSGARGAGYDVLTLRFSDFDPGERFAFSVDVDPASLQGVGDGGGGAVCGAELTGATVTVTFTDGTRTEVARGGLVPEGAVLGPRSAGGAAVTITSADAVPTPRISVSGVRDANKELPGQQVVVSEASATLTALAPRGTELVLIQLAGALDGSLPLYGVSDAELPFYANRLVAAPAFTAGTLTDKGVGTMSVALLQSPGEPPGGRNVFVAVAYDPSTSEASLPSEPVVVISSGGPGS